MKKVLIVTYYWPPNGGSGVQRWVKFSKYLPSMGWQPVIYTPENPEFTAIDESLLQDIPAEAEVIKRKINEPYALYKRFFGGKDASSSRGVGVNPLNHQKKSFAQRLAVWVRGNFFVPDPRVMWVKPSVKFLLDYLKENPVDALVTTGPPQSMHLIGLGIKKAIPSLKWLADFRDPWTKIFYFKNMGLWCAARRRHYRLEKEVLDAADGIISVSPPVADDFKSMTSTPVHLITNGFDLDDFPVTAAEPHPGKFVLTHTGLFASDGNTLNLWDVLSRKVLEDRAFASALQIRLAGKTDPEIISAISQRGLLPNLVDMGYLDHDKTVAQQRSADVLLLPLRREEEYRKVLPGKIFEYLAARRPVLGIGQEDGAAAQLLRSAGAGVMYDWDKTDPIRNFIDNQWDNFLAGEQGPINSDIGKYTRESLTAQLVKIL